MVRIEIDDKKLQKEKKKIKKEEERLRREQAKALKPTKSKKNKEGGGDPNKKPLTRFSPGFTKKIILAGVIVAGIVMLNYFRLSIVNYIDESKHQTSLRDDQVVMVDVIGLDETSARKQMDDNDIKYDIIYIYDQYCSPGNVIKTSRNAGDYIEKKTPVKVYICDDSGSGNKDGHKILTQKTPFVRDSIDVVGFKVENDKFKITIQNNNAMAIKALKYTIGYMDKNGTPNGEKTFIESEISIEPGEKFVLSDQIGNSEAYRLTVNKFICSFE